MADRPIRFRAYEIESEPINLETVEQEVSWCADLIVRGSYSKRIRKVGGSKSTPKQKNTLPIGRFVKGSKATDRKAALQSAGIEFKIGRKGEPIKFNVEEVLIVGAPFLRELMRYDPFTYSTGVLSRLRELGNTWADIYGPLQFASLNPDDFQKREDQ